MYRFIVGAVACGVAVVLWIVYEDTQSLVLSEAMQAAKSQTELLRTFRTVYTEEVITPALAAGIKVGRGQQAHGLTLPLPVTLTISMGNRSESRVHTYLYSPYPFVWRQADGGLRDTFAKEAWAYLSINATEPYTKVELVEGSKMLRYASGDIMRRSCVDCHNTHPQTPKTGWSEGDLRGILEVQVPLGKGQINPSTVFWEILLFLMPIALFGIIVVDYMRRRHVVLSEELAINVQHKNESLKQLNTLLGQISDGVFVCDSELRHILSANKQACLMLDETRENLQHLDLAEVDLHVLNSENVSLTDVIKRTSWPEAPMSVEMLLQRKDKNNLVVEVGLSTFQMQGGDYFLVIMRDITQRQMAEESRRRFIDHALSLAEGEKKRVAGELHDNIASSLTYLNLKLKSMEEAQENAHRLDLYKDIRGVTDTIMTDINRLARGLHPLVLERLGFVAAVTQYCHEMGEAHGMVIAVNDRDFDSDQATDSTRLTEVYRIVQEAVRNIIRHSEAQLASVSLIKNKSDIRVIIEDDGKGLDLNSDKTMTSGIGVTSMRERATLLGGNCTFESTQGEGTAVIVVVPLRKDLGVDTNVA
jgi:PAS domain S-box-containing protein